MNLHLILKLFLEFGKYKDLKWIKSKTFVISDIKNSDEITKIHDEIKLQTKINAGRVNGNKQNEINLKFYSPDVTDLNL